MTTVLFHWCFSLFWKHHLTNEALDNHSVILLEYPGILYSYCCYVVSPFKLYKYSPLVDPISFHFVLIDDFWSCSISYNLFLLITIWYIFLGYACLPFLIITGFQLSIGSCLSFCKNFLLLLLELHLPALIYQCNLSPLCHHPLNIFE